MPINFIPNDPMAQNGPPMRTQNPRPDRPATQTGFNLHGEVPEAVLAVGTAGFLFWQCREAALAALSAWEAADGALAQWARATPNPRRLDLLQDEGVDLNAFYDGQSVAFFHHVSGTKTTFSGASTDVVAHEVGHGLLDAIRPDLWDSTFIEPNAFHEAFGDCIALLTALSDPASRVALLAVSPDLGTANFVEATAEDLSDGVRRALGSSHAAAAPRHALNDYQWQLPTLLPASGPPAVLSSEIHSFGRVFSGCFYDVIRRIFASLPAPSEASLLTAAQTAAKLLVEGARNAPEMPRFFRAVGRAMDQADQALNGGANHAAIRDAFAGHSIALGSSAMLAPSAGLAGRAPNLEAAPAAAILAPASREDLRRRMGAAPGERLAVGVREIGGERVAEARHQREVPLGDVDPRLAGVVALASESVLVGAAGTRAAVLGALPEANTTADEVHAFVATLVRNEAIALDGAGRAAVSRRRAVATGRPPIPPTHTVRTRGGRKVLTRIRFVCGAHE
jgi:hypothetical protein